MSILRPICWFFGHRWCIWPNDLWHCPRCGAWDDGWFRPE